MWLLVPLRGFGTTSACAENTKTPDEQGRQQGNYLRVRGEYLLVGDVIGEGKELPPRARRILLQRHVVVILRGTTSACAENTNQSTPGHTWYWNYLRVRGEYPRVVQLVGNRMELPPRARRIRIWPTPFDVVAGTTSACAENTLGELVNVFGDVNYLRVRGEYHQNPTLVDEITELPPRARRIPEAPAIRRCAAGTTSACAENTKLILPISVLSRNYLRVRGEYRKHRVNSIDNMELPPRARRILLGVPGGSKIEGTTSACAENTILPFCPVGGVGNYLRVRGEYFGAGAYLFCYQELPPRARRIQCDHFQAARNPGTTSACAENTLSRVADIFGMRNYLRVRGEYPTRYATKMDRAELPPRARRILQGVKHGHDNIGTTSACAENTF